MGDSSREVSINVTEALRQELRRRRPAIRKPAIFSGQDHFVAIRAKGTEKLLTATIGAHDILFKADTVFPFSLFPDTVVIDREKLTIANRLFFRVAKIISVPIQDILSVEADIGPFFGSVHMTSRYFFTNPHSINFMWRKDAIKMQRLLQGYIIARERNIDCANVDKDQLGVLLLDLGEGNTD